MNAVSQLKESPGTAGAARQEIISAEHIGKTFGGSVVALEDINFTVQQGDFISLIGPSGCGKSTLLRLVAGLLPASGGKLNVMGSPMTKPRPEIGMMFQKPTLLAWKSVMDNVLLPKTLAGGATRKDREKAIELLHLVGLEGFEYSFPNQLSGGMQQRVALARLLNTGAEILLLDEPFGALDEFTRERLNVELLRIQREVKATILFVTHNIQEAVFLADKVFVMTPRPGRLEEIVDVPLARPREMEITKSDEFNRRVFEIRDVLGAAT
ncbi:ABC transporter ATP-binding protein [Histidinibacterium aquaticum]|uniref:ABC transporter ATP-binding protein n=1 Tax=Histidinibacterium aquaticum TaxID=2613962 RepID=A0A5J5GEW8_9RHOB|nr:ABC transporter ATP-binding protein [Histidinibacterium aquaticum]KAA9006769.1 ABC transporter ATP-binding protein [Histidinibacterium aquaticum]